jgi:hypothetical protein
MLVTLHARHTAMYRLLRQLGLRAAGDRIEFHRLDGSWARDCGLRRNDLINTLSELAISGQITQTPGPEGTVIHVTDRGSLKLQAPLPLLRAIRLADLRESLAEAVQTAVTLVRARLRSRRLFRLSKTLVVDRRRERLN